MEMIKYVEVNINESTSYYNVQKLFPKNAVKDIYGITGKI